MNGVLAKRRESFLADHPIQQDVDESILVNIFEKSREELKELHERMQRELPAAKRSSNMAFFLRFREQLSALEAYEQFLLWHPKFDTQEGNKLLEWFERNGRPAITTFTIDQAAASLKRATAAPPEPEVAPIIVKQPGSISVAPLEPATFSVEVVGTKPLEFQWLVKGCELIVGANSPKYMTFASEYSDGKLYCCRISNKFGSIVSYPARLRMVPRS